MTGNTNLIEVTFTSQSDKWKVRGDTKNFNDKFTLILLHVLNFQRHQISVVVQYNVVLNDNSCTNISYEYITHQFYAQVVCIFWDLMHFYGAGQMPTRTMFPRFYTILGSPHKNVNLGSYCILTDTFC